MKSCIKKIVAAAVLALIAGSTVTADACDRGGRFSIGRGYSYSAPRLTYRSYAPTYSQPTYPQTYSQPQHNYSQPVPFSRPVAPQHVAPQHVSPQPTFGQPEPTQVSRQVTPRPVAPQLVTQQPVTQRRVAAQPQAAPQRVTQAAAPRGTQPMTQRATVRQVSATQPATAQPATQRNAAASALQLLASMNTTTARAANPQPATSVPLSTPRPAAASQPSNQIPQFTAPSTTFEGHVGTWNVQLPGNQSVELTLNNDRSFTWTATKQGKASSFTGQYRLESGRLTLVRSTDLQQMAGSWTGQDANFTFKLDGATNSGLTFTRA